MFDVECLLLLLGHVFVNFNTADRSCCRELIEELRAKGCKLWIMPIKTSARST